jgi:hypothetical protein
MTATHIGSTASVRTWLLSKLKPTHLINRTKFLHNQSTPKMSANSQATGAQEPTGSTSQHTFTRYAGTQARSGVAGRRRLADRPLHINTQASHIVHVEELQYRYLRDHERDRPEINKPLPPLPGHHPSSRPVSPMERASHWVNKKVVTPVKEYFKAPEVLEMIGHNDSHALFAELRTPDATRNLRSRPSVDPEAGPSRRSASISSLRSFRSTPTTPRFRDSNDSMTSSVRNALDTAQHVGSRLGLRNGSGRLVFSDQAPAGMMDPCSVCGREPTGVLYHGRCRECR